MAWPSTVAPHQAASAAQYNGIVLAIQTWQGDVSAGSHKLTNCGGITLAANAVLDVSAGGINIKGALALAADPVPLTVSTLGGTSLQFFTSGTALNPQIRSSTGGLIITSQAATITRNLRISVVEGAEEFLQALSGRLRIASNSLDVDLDVVAAGKLQGASLNITNPANITLGSNWTNWTPVITASGGMVLSAVTVQNAQYLRVGALLFIYLQLSFTVGGTPDLVVYASLPVAPLINSVLASTFFATPAASWPTPAMARGDTIGAVMMRATAAATYAAGSYNIMVAGFYKCA